MSIKKNKNQNCVYLKTSLGVWTRARVDYESGYLIYEWSPRVVLLPNSYSFLGLNGEVINTGSIAQFEESEYIDSWFADGALNLDLIDFTGFSQKLREDHFVNICNHICRLIAFGFGETPQDVLNLFEGLPFGNWFIEECVYEGEILLDNSVLNTRVRKSGDCVSNFKIDTLIEVNNEWVSHPLSLESVLSLKVALY